MTKITLEQTRYTSGKRVITIEDHPTSVDDYVELLFKPLLLAEGFSQRDIDGVFYSEDTCAGCITEAKKDWMEEYLQVDNCSCKCHVQDK